MAFWSSLSGNGKQPYEPWSADYFHQRAAWQASLVRTGPIPDFDAPPGFTAIEKRDGRHHTWITLRDPQHPAALQMLKTARAGSGHAAVRRLSEELSFLVGLSTSYHLAPFDVLDVPGVAGGVAGLFTYCCGDLEERAAAGMVPAAEVAHYGMQLAAELVEIHGAGLLHLAIAPSNVLFECMAKEASLARWRLVLGNFDLRGVRLGEEVLPGLAPDDFAAPEQHAGAPVGAWTDIWGLGATLFFLCARRPPARPEPGAAVSLEAIAGKYPDWLVAVIRSCLEVDPKRRPADATAIFDALLAHVRIISDLKGADGEAKGHAGPSREEARVEVADRFLLASANRLSRVQGGPEAIMKDLGYVTRFKEANRLLKAGTRTSLRRAVGILDRVLGDWGDPVSPLGQFAKNPDGPSFAAREPPDRWVGKERWSTAGLPIPIGMLWGMLDLRCRCHVALIEAEGRKDDIDRAARFCESWLRMGSLGTASSKPTSMATYPAAKCLIHLAQCLRYAGQFERAKALTEAAIKEAPGDLEAQFIAFMVARDLGDGAEANRHAHRIAKAAIDARRQDVYAKIFMFAATCRSGWATTIPWSRLPFAPSPSTGSGQAEFGPSTPLRYARADRGPAPPEEAFEVAESGDRLERWFAAADLAALAGEQQRAREAIERIRKEPRFNLATDWWYQEELEALEARLDTAAAPDAQASATPELAVPSSALPQALAEEARNLFRFEVVHFHPETGLWNEYGFAQVQKLTPKKWILAINLAFLVDDDVSDALGQDVANEAVWLLGSVLKRNGGNEIDAALPHPDQLTACHDERGLLEEIAEGIKQAAEKVAIYVSREGGGGVLQKGFDFKYATGPDYQEADLASMKAGDRGVLTSCPAGQLGGALAEAREAGFLLLDGDVLRAERSSRDAQLPARGDKPISRPGVEPAARPDDGEGGPVWPPDAGKILAAAAEDGTYFQTAMRLVSRAAAQAIARRRAQRAGGPQP